MSKTTRGGATFRVSDVVFDGVAAVEKRAASPEASASLVREARFLGAFVARFSRVPMLLQVGRDDVGHFLIESRLEGLSLFEAMDAWTLDGGAPMSLRVHLAAEVLRAVSELHALEDPRGSLGLVHGDPSFDNVIVSPHGRAQLVDFGEARTRDTPEETSTRQGGTPPYAAPELLRGEAHASRATDRYAAAAVALALLIDRPVAEAPSSAATLDALASRGIAAEVIAAAPRGLRAELAAALAFDPRRRSPSLSPLLAALVTFARG